MQEHQLIVHKNALVVARTRLLADLSAGLSDYPPARPATWLFVHLQGLVLREMTISTVAIITNKMIRMIDSTSIFRPKKIICGRFCLARPLAPPLLMIR